MKGTSPMQTAYQLHCTAAVPPILLLHPISSQSCVHVPAKASKPQVGLAHKQDNRRMIHWSRTTGLRPLKVQGPAKGKHGLEPFSLWGVSQSSARAPLQLCTPTGEAQPGQLEKEEGGAAIPSKVCLHRCQYRLCTLPLWICGWQCLFVLSVGVHTGIVLYCYKLDDTGITTAWGPLAWEGEKKSPHPKSQGILLP